MSSPQKLTESRILYYETRPLGFTQDCNTSTFPFLHQYTGPIFNSTVEIIIMTIKIVGIIDRLIIKG